MITLKIYDPAMCCSSGICGPNVNEKLVHLSAFLKGLSKNEYTIERYNLSQQPNAYVINKTVAKILQEKGTDELPVIFVNDKLVCKGNYPTIDELADHLKIGCTNADNHSNCCNEGTFQ